MTTNSKDDDVKVVPVADGPDHGYIGHVPDKEPNDSYTVTGVTGGTGNVNDIPKSTARTTGKA